MPTYVEKYYQHSGDDVDTGWTTVYEIVDQPRRYHFASKALSWFGLKFDKVIHLLEPLAYRMHKLHCDDDCGESIYMLPDGSEDKPRAECVYLGLCAGIDLKVYRLSRKSAKTLGRSDGVQTSK